MIFDIDKLSKRTQVDVELLRRLPDERLSQYFNRTDESISTIMPVLASAAASATGLTIMALAVMQPNNMIPLLACNSLMTLACVGLTYLGLRAHKTNASLSKDIQAEIAKSIPQQNTLKIS